MSTFAEEEAFTPQQCEAIAGMRRYLEGLKEEITQNKNSVTSLASVFTEKLNTTNIFLEAMRLHVQGLTAENERLQSMLHDSDERIMELEDAVRELALNTLPSGNRGVFASRFPRLDSGTDANTQVTVSTGGDTDPVSSMSEVIDLDVLHQ